MQFSNGSQGVHAPPDSETVLLVEMFKVEIDRESDGRWIADVSDLPGVLVCGDSAEEADSKARALAARVLAERLEHGESTSE